MDRVLLLEGVHNFRDYGGYQIAGVGRLKRGLLWRSGQHHGATDGDMKAIAALNLADVFDLRSRRERQAHPCRRPDDFGARIHHPLSVKKVPPPQAAPHAAPHIAAAKPARRSTPQDTRDSLRRNYHVIAFRPELQDLTRQLIATAATGEGPTLVNCMAGKDRTGIAVAMLHVALGVHRDDIFEDYLLTNTAGDVDARIASGIETIREIAGDADDASLRVMMGVEPEYLEAAFSAIDAKYGSAASYLEQVMGVDTALRSKLYAALVE